ncbi:hypothetical protein EC957_004229 [Mortierella hygrophila]|uniref:Uncharacterized protein n=1 Tax=Mortierella hygrophila TaxID=979708 RepID=A0A9P6FEY8_9FUNG|nr:hypothetical protein EC957_004229 [Mortierella hygrophila]
MAISATAPAASATEAMCYFRIKKLESSKDGHGSDMVLQVDHRNAARPANDDYGEWDGLDKAQGYGQSQDLSPAVAKDRKRRKQGSATDTSMDYDDENLLDLALDLELQLEFHDGRLDIDEMKRLDFDILYENMTLSNLRGVLKSLVTVGVLSTAGVYFLLLTYKLAKDLYVCDVDFVALDLDPCRDLALAYAIVDGFRGLPPRPDGAVAKQGYFGDDFPHVGDLYSQEDQPEHAVAFLKRPGNPSNLSKGKPQ